MKNKIDKIFEKFETNHFCIDLDKKVITYDNIPEKNWNQLKSEIKKEVSKCH